MKAVVPVRKSLKVRTAFNILGPLLNPAGAAYGLIGVYSPAISPLMASTLQRLGTKRALVVHSHGLDELTPMGDAELLEVTPQGTRSYRQHTSSTLAACLRMRPQPCHQLPMIVLGISCSLMSAKKGSSTHLVSPEMAGKDVMSLSFLSLFPVITGWCLILVCAWP